MGEPLLFIPGLMQDARAFLPQIVALGRHHAAQIYLPVQDSVERMSEEALRHAPPRFALIGHGLGGEVALDILRRAPERVSRLVLLATDPLAEPAQQAAQREARMVAAQAGRLKAAIAEDVPASALADTPDRPEVLALMQDMALGLGGEVALDILRRAPERVSRLVLLATDPLAEPAQQAAQREARMVAAQAGRLKAAIAEDVPASALADTPDRPEVLALMQDMALGLGEGVYLRQCRALQRRPDQQRTLRRATVPALFLAGLADTLLPLRRHEFARDLMPSSALKPIPQAGHLPMLEAPEAVTAAIEGFLTGPMILR